jgi:hypothetical protein
LYIVCYLIDAKSKGIDQKEDIMTKNKVYFIILVQGLPADYADYRRFRQTNGVLLF